MKFRRIAALLSVIAGTAANAQDVIYVGVGAGNFDYEESTDIFFSGISSTVSTYKLFAGLEFSEHFALEIDYGETDDVAHSVNGDLPPFGNFDYDLVLDFKMTTLKAVGQIPLEWGALLGGIGYFSSDGDFNERFAIQCCGVQTNAGATRDNGTTAMLGIEWRFGQFGTRFGVRLEYDWWDFSAADASALGLAFSYGF